MRLLLHARYGFIGARLSHFQPTAVITLCAALAMSPAPGTAGRARLPVVTANSNTARAGILSAGVLSVALEARPASYAIDGPKHPSFDIEAFSEPGKPPLIPGPLVRAPAGADLRFSIHNALAVPLTFFIPAAAHGGADRLDAMDSVVVAPGETGHLETRASTPGNYIYRATTPAGAKWFRHLTGLLAGALVIDTAGAPARPRDRVFVMMATADSATTAYLDTVHPAQFRGGRVREVFTINGLPWPLSERVHATVGDTLHWRVINASEAPHPMHLHGFFYRVDAFAGPEIDRYGRPEPGQMVVTQFMPGFSSMSMTWSPDRPGNWLFHCHFAVHLRPDSLSAATDDPYHRDMVGLALGTTVVPRRGGTVSRDGVPVRRLRLVATADAPITSQFFETPAHTTDSTPPMHFVLDDGTRHVDTHTDLSPELDLVRGEPVAITIVNHLPEPTSVHWHGIEVADSYMDGVPGFSGDAQHLTPAIAPGDSFVARFTPPRAGTFMYHAHIDEIREQLAGLEGAIVVRDARAAPSPNDHVVFFKEVSTSGARRYEVNGKAAPDTLVLHAGVAARLRLINLNSNSFAPTFRIMSDTTLKASGDAPLSWTLVAKDGFDVQPKARRLSVARQVVSIGETYDFEFISATKAMIQLEIWSSVVADLPLRPRLLVTVPILVK